jgi:excisionase family DNA binding protein
LLAVREAAEYLGVSVASVERLVYRGRLPFVRIGGSTRYDIYDLDTFIESNRQRNRRRVA